MHAAAEGWCYCFVSRVRRHSRRRYGNRICRAWALPYEPQSSAWPTLSPWSWLPRKRRVHVAHEMLWQDNHLTRLVRSISRV